MQTQPILLNELDVIGYGDVLPDGKGPAVVPPVFRHRTEPSRCYAPPFRVTGNWLLEPYVVSFDELQELERDETITLPEGFKHPARPDHQLWVDGEGKVRYEPASEAKRAQHKIHLEHLNAALSAMRDGRFDEARRLAGVALAANDRAGEPCALIAALHVLRGELPQAAFLKNSAEQAGLNGDSFLLTLKDYIESIPPETWENVNLNVERVVETCEALGTEVWIPFHLTEEEFRRYEPILHHYSRVGGEHARTVSCPGTEAILMSERETLLVACRNAEANSESEQLQRANLLAFAAETMIHLPGEISRLCQTPNEVVQQLGQKLRSHVHLVRLRNC